jgi:AcrR family transcriptional regulator
VKRKLSRFLEQNNFEENRPEEENAEEASSVVPRKEKRAATRERLVQAAIELLRKEGAAALNTVNVTRAAGIVQSGFYMHFKNIDECKKAAAERVAKRIRDYVALHRRRMHKLDPDDLNLLREHCEKMLEIFHEEKKFAEIFISYRRDLSPLGEAMRELQSRLHNDLVEDLSLVIFQGAHLSAKEQERVSLQAEMILAAALIAGEALIEGRVGNIKVAADLLAINIMTSTDAAFGKTN